MLVKMIFAYGLFTLVLGLSFAYAADPVYIKSLPNTVSKLEVIKGLAISNNKEVYYKCQAVKLDDDKGTVKTR